MRTAQQLSIWAVAPIACLILIPVALLLTWGAARLFQCEAIRTRWR